MSSSSSATSEYIQTPSTPDTPEASQTVQAPQNQAPQAQHAPQATQTAQAPQAQQAPQDPGPGVNVCQGDEDGNNRGIQCLAHYDDGVYRCRFCRVVPVRVPYQRGLRRAVWNGFFFRPITFRHSQSI